MSDHFDINQYRIQQEPFYQPTGNEVALYEAAYAARLPVMLKGPTGCGKTLLAQTLARILDEIAKDGERKGVPANSIAKARAIESMAWNDPAMPAALAPVAKA